MLFFLEIHRYKLCHLLNIKIPGKRHNKHLQLVIVNYNNKKMRLLKVNSIFPLTFIIYFLVSYYFSVYFITINCITEILSETEPELQGNENNSLENGTLLFDFFLLFKLLSFWFIEVIFSFRI